MTQPAIERLLRRHMDKRTLARILGTKDREINPLVPEEVAEHLRFVVLSEMHRFLELVLDVIDALDDESCTVNELFLDVLEAEAAGASSG